MASTSRSVTPHQLASGLPIALTIAHVLMGALGSVAFFGMLAMLNTPYKGVLGNGFILSISIAAIASIAIVARDHGTLSGPAN
jgi:hypothetical protein